MKYILNDNYFDDFNTEDKIYLLGLLFADGCNNGENISIALSGKEDSLILEKLSKFIYKKHRPLLVNHLSKKNYKHQDSYKLYICNKEVCYKLNKIGLTKNKTYDLKFPTIIDNEIKFRHFLRGYFDGDGCVNIDGNRITFSIVGYSLFLEDLKIKMEQYIGIKIKNKVYNTSSFAKEIKISSRSIVRKIYKFLYKDSTLFFERKKDKFDQYFNNPKFEFDKITSSRYRWVTYDKLRKKWKSSVWKNGKNNNLGRFENEVDAYNAALNFNKI